MNTNKNITTTKETGFLLQLEFTIRAFSENTQQASFSLTRDIKQITIIPL